MPAQHHGNRPSLHCRARACCYDVKLMNYEHQSKLLRFGPPILAELAWWIWALIDPETRLGRFAEPTPYIGKYYYMSVTMLFGSLVAGATSEGGGAIAFPVMTLLLNVPPPVARDFSFAIQAFGMTIASVTILGLQIPLDYEALLWASLGGVVGLVTGLGLIAPFLPAAYAKLLFVSVWMTFAVALFQLNSRGRDRRVYKSALESDQLILLHQYLTDTKLEDRIRQESDERENMESRENIKNSITSNEKRRGRIRACVLAIVGCFGGICSSVAGSGLDIATFSVLTLYFRVSEKVATPTSVVLMALNAVVGVFCRTLIGIGGVGEWQTVWNFVSVCVPIVVLGAPVGATISSLLARHWLAWLLYFLDTVQFVSSLAIIQPWSKPSPHNVWLCVTSVVTLLLGSGVFFQIASWGKERGELFVSCSNETSITVAPCSIHTVGCDIEHEHVLEQRSGMNEDEGAAAAAAAAAASEDNDGITTCDPDNESLPP